MNLGAARGEGFQGLSGLGVCVGALQEAGKGEAGKGAAERSGELRLQLMMDMIADLKGTTADPTTPPKHPTPFQISTHPAAPTPHTHPTPNTSSR